MQKIHIKWQARQKKQPNRNIETIKTTAGFPSKMVRQKASRCAASGLRKAGSPVPKRSRMGSKVTPVNFQISGKTCSHRALREHRRRKWFSKIRGILQRFGSAIASRVKNRLNLAKKIMKFVWPNFDQVNQNKTQFQTTGSSNGCRKSI